MLNYSKVFDLIRNIYMFPSYINKHGRALMPLRYFMELTYRCNLECPYCYVGNDRNKEELTTKEWFKIIDQLPFYSFPTLVGGEPLIRKDFIEILERVSKKTFHKSHVITNGLLINQEIINAFIKYKLLLLSVSLDGYGETHDKNRGKDGIFDKTVNNLELFNKEKNRPMVDIKTIVLKNNLDDLIKLYKLCIEMKFNFLSISFLRNNNYKQNSVLHNQFIPEFNGDYPIELYFDMEHFKEIYKELYSLSKKAEVKLRFAPKFEYLKNPLAEIEGFFHHNPKTPLDKIYKPCIYPYSNMMITPEGDIYPCLSQKIGNIKDLSLKELFNSPNYCCFRKNLKASGGVFGACQMCCELEPKTTQTLI